MQRNLEQEAEEYGSTSPLPQFPRRLTAVCAETLQAFHANVSYDTMRQVHSSDDAYRQGTYADTVQKNIEMIGEGSLPRRACTSRPRVASISLLSGKSDTTAKRSGWQVS